MTCLATRFLDEAVVITIPVVIVIVLSGLPELIKSGVIEVIKDPVAIEPSMVDIVFSIIVDPVGMVISMDDMGDIPDPGVPSSIVDIEYIISSPVLIEESMPSIVVIKDMSSIVLI